jgi:hypothetical protein
MTLFLWIAVACAVFLIIARIVKGGGISSPSGSSPSYGNDMQSPYGQASHHIEHRYDEEFGRQQSYGQSVRRPHLETGGPARPAGSALGWSLIERMAAIMGILSFLMQIGQWMRWV